MKEPNPEEFQKHLVDVLSVATPDQARIVSDGVMYLLDSCKNQMQRAEKAEATRDKAIERAFDLALDGGGWIGVKAGHKIPKDGFYSTVNAEGSIIIHYFEELEELRGVDKFISIKGPLQLPGGLHVDKDCNGGGPG